MNRNEYRNLNFSHSDRSLYVLSFPFSPVLLQGFRKVEQTINMLLPVVLMLSTHGWFTPTLFDYHTRNRLWSKNVIITQSRWNELSSSRIYVGLAFGLISSKKCQSMYQSVFNFSSTRCGIHRHWSVGRSGPGKRLAFKIETGGPRREHITL